MSAFQYPATETLWRYHGPNKEGMEPFHGRLHEVAISGPDEVITVGLGRNAVGDHGWLGSPAEFRRNFTYVGKARQ